MKLFWEKRRGVYITYVANVDKGQRRIKAPVGNLAKVKVNS